VLTAKYYHTGDLLNAELKKRIFLYLAKYLGGDPDFKKKDMCGWLVMEKK
jgi:hypothetical protein